jgi:hypothetical protein
MIAGNLPDGAKQARRMEPAKGGEGGYITSPRSRNQALVAALFSIDDNAVGIHLSPCGSPETIAASGRREVSTRLAHGDELVRHPSRRDVEGVSPAPTDQYGFA